VFLKRNIIGFFSLFFFFSRPLSVVSEGEINELVVREKLSIHFFTSAKENY